jgi:hypothetical protein
MLLDELIVKLGLNSADLESKAGSSVKKLGDIEKAGKGAESGIAGIGSASKGTSLELGGLVGKMSAFLALLGGTYAIKSFIADTIKTNTQLYFLASNLGMSVQSLSAWGTVAKEFGGTAEGLQGTLKHLSMEATNFALRGQSSLIPFLSMMGVGFNQNPEKMLAGIGAWVQATTKAGTSRPLVHNILEQMGIDEGTINAMFAGTKALNSYLAAAKKVAPTEKEAAEAAKMNAQLVIMDAHLKKVGIDLLDKAAPALEKFFDLINKIGTWIQGHQTITEWIGGITVGIGALTASLTLLGVALPAIGAGFAALTGPLGLIASGLAAISAGALWGMNASKKFSKQGPDAYRKMAEEDAAKYGVNPNLVKAVMGVESSWNPNAVSKKGAMGLMQLMPGTAMDLGVTNPFDPAQNIDAGTRLLKKLLDKYGDPREALAAYNSGNPHGNSKETRDYIAKVMGAQSSKYPSGFWNGLKGHLSSPMPKVPNMPPPNMPPSHSLTNHIGNINIMSRATNAKQLAADLGRGTDWLTFAAQSNGAQV